MSLGDYLAFALVLVVSNVVVYVYAIRKGLRLAVKDLDKSYGGAWRLNRLVGREDRSSFLRDEETTYYH